MNSNEWFIEWTIHWMNRSELIIECTGINDALNDQGWMIQSMNRIDESLIGQEWVIHWMNMNEWFGEWTGMNDSLYERFIEWSEMNDSMNEQEWVIHWMNRNEWFDEWTGMNGILDDQGWMIH